MRKIAVIGGGIFGCTAALVAAYSGKFSQVDLYEKKPIILGGASGHNQYRLHRGYHYPRAPETVQECIDGLESFGEMYPIAPMNLGPEERHYYAIAKDGSMTSAEEYALFLDKHSLPAKRTAVAPVNYDAVDLVIEAEEQWFDQRKLRRAVCTRLAHCDKIRVFTDTPMPKRVRWDYDGVIIATYADTNDTTWAIDGYEPARQDVFQFEVVEKPLIWLPDEAMQKVGIVIMDGGYCSVDPYGHTGLHILGHVDAAIHATNVGERPAIPAYLADYINQGVISNPGQSKFEYMISRSSFFVPALGNAFHVGSMFTVRTVLPKLEDTDARPTMVEYLEKDQFIVRILSGKIPTCVEAAKKAVEMV